MHHLLSHSVMSDSMRRSRLSPARLLCPWHSPGKNTGVGCHVLLQAIFPTQGSNPCLLSLLYWQVGVFFFFFFTISTTWEARPFISNSYLIFVSTLGGNYYYHPQFTDEVPKASRNLVVFSWSQS